MVREARERTAREAGAAGAAGGERTTGAAGGERTTGAAGGERTTGAAGERGEGPGPVVSFGEVLRALRTARGMSQAGVAVRAGLDRSYVNRIEAGERGTPAAPTVEALIGALQLGPSEADRLTAAAGFLPQALRALGPNDPTVLLLAERLADPALSDGARAALRATVETVVRHWSNASHE